MPIEARNRFKIKPGDKLIAVSADSEDFEKIILLKSESMAKMFSFLTEFEGQLKKEGAKGVENIYQKGIDQIKAAFKENKLNEEKKSKGKSNKR